MVRVSRGTFWSVIDETIAGRDGRLVVEEVRRPLLVSSVRDTRLAGVDRRTVSDGGERLSAQVFASCHYWTTMLFKTSSDVRKPCNQEDKHSTY